MTVPEGAVLLVWVVVVALSISLVLLTTIFVHRMNQLYYERRLERGVLALQTSFEQFILENMPKGEFLALARQHIDAALHLSLRFSAVLKGKSKQRVIEVASDLGFIDQAIKDARSFSWKKREVSAMEIGVFGNAEAVDVLQTLVQDRQSEVRHTALRSMSALDSSLAFGALIELLEEPGHLDAARIIEIVREVNNPDLEILNSKLFDTSLPLLTRLFLLDLVGEWAEYRVAPTLHELIKEDNKEIVIRSIKALGRIGNEASIPHLIGLIDHSEWEVRAQTIRAIAAFEYVEALALIANCLADNAFWVRRAAAEVLLDMGSEGRKFLEIENLPDDRFARDIANYIRGRSSDDLLASDLKNLKPAQSKQQMEQA